MRVRPARCHTFVQLCQEASTMCIPKNVYLTAHVSCSCVCSLCPAEILLSGQQKGGARDRRAALPRSGLAFVVLSALLSVSGQAVAFVVEVQFVQVHVFHCEMPELRTRMSPHPPQLVMWPASID